jgi:hypothetical protein
MLGKGLKMGLFDGYLNPPLSATPTKIFNCYWKILKHHGLSCFRFFR